MINYTNLYPKDSFIDLYMQYMKEEETPRAFDFYSALWLIGVTHDDIVINSPSSPSCGFNLILVSSVGNTRREKNVEVVRGCRHKIEGNSRTIDEDEDPFDTEKKIYQEEELDYKIGKGGNSKQILQNITTNKALLVGSSTPVKLYRDCNALLMEPDYARHFIFINSTERKGQRPWPRERDMAGLSRSLQTYVSGSKILKGRLDINEGGIKAFTKWYRGRPLDKDSQQSILKSTEDATVLRIAACLSINDGTYEIQSRHIGNARRVNDEVGASRASLYEDVDLGAVGRIMSCVEKARMILLEVGGDGIVETRLYNRIKSSISHSEYKLLIRVMHEAGLIEMTRKGVTNKGGRPYNLLRATSQVRREMVVSEVVSLMGLHPG